MVWHLIRGTFPHLQAYVKIRKVNCMKRRGTMLLPGLALLALLAGCRVHVDKDQSGQEKNVQVDTPFGGMHINTNQLTAADLGLPAYPGATIVTDDENKQSADIHMGFGEWQMRVRAISYATADSQDKVLAFYKKALGRYGDVITCEDKSPVGKPNTTSEGLTCADDGKDGHVKVNNGGNGVQIGKGLELKAGSKHHQRVVGIENSLNGKTKFALVELQLPASMGTGSSD